MDKLTVIKVGSNILDDEVSLDAFLKKFVALSGIKILVHGGGKVATEISMRLGYKPQVIDGRRVTTPEELDVVTMVYGGLINKQLVAKLQSMNCNAMGMSGADGNSIVAKKRTVSEIDYGWVGDVTQVNTSSIKTVIKNNMVPVFCSLTHAGTGQLLNTNADTVASELAIALSSIYTVKLWYCFEKKGVLASVKDDESVISVIDFELYEELRDKGVLHEGMLPKLKNCFHALKKGVDDVWVGDVSLFEGKGTRLKLKTEL